MTLIRLALEPEAQMVARTNAAGGEDAEIFREDTPPLRIRLRPWAPGNVAEDPETVWVITKASRTTVQELRERRENFVALSGAVRIVRGWLFLDRTDLKPLPAPARHSKQADPFADRNSLIPRTLLSHSGRSWGIRELAETAEVALGTASQVVRALTEMGVVRVQQNGRAVRVSADDPMRLLTRWFAAYSWERNERVAFHAPLGEPSRFVRRLPKLLGDSRWALTMHAGAARVAPYATWDRVHIYVGAESATILLDTGQRLGWEPALDGRVLLLKPYYKTSVWQGLQLLEGMPVVSTLQLTLDLWNYPLRGREQAEHLLQNVLEVHTP
ncbi:MAG TPA: winged helix-turn-helix domain-containing protein [Longimicrobium sp.]|nr:winged helix-turn-helix domain-containing protein [Longimicrobium sp.]